MAEHAVWFETVASTSVEVTDEDLKAVRLEFPDMSDDEALEEAAWRVFPSPRACHHCSGKFDLGDDWSIT